MVSGDRLPTAPHGHPGGEFAEILSASPGPPSGRAHDRRRRPALRRLTIDGYLLIELWIEPDLWSWIY